MTFDADSHVEESAQTWKYLDEKFVRRRPIPITLEDQPALLGQNSFWLIDGAVVPRTSGKGLSLFGTPATSRHAREKPFSIGSQELTDVDARIRDLDKFGIHTQIINSTLLNATLSPDIDFEYGLCRAYNTWVHEICEQSSGRLRWNAMLRLTHIEKALEELRRVEALGAAAAEIHGMAGDKLLDSREFDPFWSEAERLNTPIYVHIGFESPAFTGLFQNLFMSIAFSNRASLLMGFLAIVGTGVAEGFRACALLLPKPASNGCRGSRMSWTLTGAWGRASLRTIPALAILEPNPARSFAKATFTLSAKKTKTYAGRWS